MPPCACSTHLGTPVLQGRGGPAGGWIWDQPARSRWCVHKKVFFFFVLFYINTNKHFSSLFSEYCNLQNSFKKMHHKRYRLRPHAELVKSLYLEHLNRSKHSNDADLITKVEAVNVHPLHWAENWLCFFEALGNSALSSSKNRLQRNN